MSTIEAPPRAYPTRGGAALAPAPVRRPAVPVQPRHLRVVAPAERVRRRLTPATGVLLTGLLFVTLFLIAIAHTLLMQGQIHLDGLDSKLSVEQARYQELRKEVAEMESPARVVAEAEALGMVTPDDLVYLQPDTPEASGLAGGGAADDTSDAVADLPGSTWSVIKPLLGTPAP